MKSFKKLFAILVCFGMILSLCLAVSAQDAGVQSETEEEIEWVVSDDQQTLTYGNETYALYPLPATEWFRPYEFYKYSQSVKVGQKSLNMIGHPVIESTEEEIVLNQDMVVVYDYIGSAAMIRVYVTPQGAKELDRYVSGKYTQYELAQGYYTSSVISGALVNAWASSEADMTVDVTKLGTAPSYKVLGYDSTLTLAHVIGEVFEYKGDYLFVNYDKLDNSHFDSNGNLSFRSGTVPALCLNDAHARQVAEAIEAAQSFSPYVHGEQAELLDPSISMIIFLVMVAPLLYLLPLATLILGIVLRSIKRIPHRERWTLVIVLSAVALGLAILASAALLVPTFFL